MLSDQIKKNPTDAEKRIGCCVLIKEGGSNKHFGRNRVEGWTKKNRVEGEGEVFCLGFFVPHGE